MLRALRVAGADAPQRRGEDQREEQKKGARQLQPQNAARAADGTQKSAHAARHSSGDSLDSRFFRRQRLRRAGRRKGDRRRGGRGAQPFAGDASGDPQPDSQCAADGLRFHFDMMVAAAAAAPFFPPDFRDSQLLAGGDGSKVERTQALPALFARRPQPQEATVTSRMRELIEQLGEAIHESVIESEQIAGVVQDIRKHGFDVLLMLEATIGLNEVASREADGAESGGDEGAAPPFTQNDLHFLRSLRIAVEGEEKDSAAPDAG